MASARHPQRFGRFSSILSAHWLALLLALVCGPAATAWAQLPRTRLTLVTPSIGQVGTTVEVTVAGSDIDEVSALSFSHAGITAVQKTTDSGGKKTPVANTFVVTIAKTAPVGLYDARITGLFGASNPMTFAVTGREVVRESEGNNSFAEADEFTLGKTVYGQINGAADVDYLKFTGKKGQRVVIDCQAARVDSSLHAICEVYSTSAGRVRLLSFTRRQVGHDPITDITLPTDGEYFVKIFDERFAGGVAHTYLLTAHTNPHIDFIRPAAGVPGTTGSFTLFGRNLPGGQPSGVRLAGRELQKLAVKIPVPKNSADISLVGNRVNPLAAGLDAFEYTFKAANGSSNPVPIYFGVGTMAVEVEPNNTAAKAQKIQVPGDITGVLQQRGDEDVYEFETKAGTVFWIEVYSQRIGAPADPYLIVDQVLVDKEGKEIPSKRLTAVDDNGTNLFANHFDTASNDPVYRFAAPADGKYRVTVRDRNFQGVGSTRHLYRLSIRSEDRDYRVVVLPVGQNTGANSNTAQNYGIALRKGEHFLCRALVFRRDGFNAAIDVTAEGLPKGVVCHGTTIGVGQSSAPLVFTATEDAPELTTSVRLVAKATLDDPIKVAAAAAATKAVVAALAAVPKATAAIKPLDDAAKKAQGLQGVAEKKYAADNKLSTEAVKLKVAADKKAVDTKKVSDTAAAADVVAKKKVTDTTKAATDTKKVADLAAKKLTTATAADKKADEAIKAAAADAVKKKAAEEAKKKTVAELKTATEAKAKADKAATDAAKAAADAKTAATKAAKTAADTKKVTADAAKAKLATDKKAADTAKVTAASKTAFDKTDAALKAAKAKLVASQKAETDAKQKVTSTQAAAVAAKKARVAAAKPLNRPARVGTIVINGAQNNSAVSRLASTLVVSVMKEKAPFQVQTDGVIRVDANRLRQILVPVKLAKRNGFNDAVTLTWVGQPKNVQVANKPIAKGKDSQLLRIFLPANAPIGTFALYLRGQGKVSYSRNPFRVARGKVVQTKANEVAKAAAAVLKTANEAKTKADKAATDTKKAADAAAKLAADMAKKLTAAQAVAKKATDAAKAATDAKAKADKAAADTKKTSDVAAKTATDAAKALTDAQAADKKAGEAVKAAGDDAAKKKAAEQAKQKTAAALKTATEAKTKADKTAADAKKVSDAATKTAADAAKTLTAAQVVAKKGTEAAKVATAAKVKADKTAADTKKASDVAAAAKVKTDATAKTATDKDKATKATKAAADKEVTAATAAAKAKPLTAFPPSGPIIISIRENPATLKAAVPGGGALKRGAKLDVKVTVTRSNGFTGPLTLTLPLPPGIADVKASAVTIAADKTEGVLSITAGPKATEGALANMVVRAKMQYDGREALVDLPITIKVSK